MIIDNLTLAGLIVSSLFALMPILMGREFLRVRGCGEAPILLRSDASGGLRTTRVQLDADAH